MRDPKKVIIAPVLSEKAEKLREFYNQYVFKVEKEANKIEIKNAIEKRFDVKVRSVRTMNMPRKRRTRMTRGGVIVGKTASWKKAVVTLEEGYSIDLLGNVQ
ncbi:MAG: 50S ribosomal protein L23 [Calditrichia bacterium]